MPKILVVDDNDALRRMVEQWLVRDGHEVTTAVDGAKALRLLRTLPFDLVVTDLVMPHVEGIELLLELQAKASSPKVIVMSGGHSSGIDYLETAAMLGAAETLSKPFMHEALAEAVDRALGKSE